MTRTMKGLMALALLAAVGYGGRLAYAAGFFTNGVPPAGGSQYPTTMPLTGNETIPADTNLPSGQNPASEAITVKQLAGAVGATPGTSWRNGLIGGDFGTNLWQRGTTSASITTALLYGPDRWWGLSGTGTAFTIIKETAAADITQGYAASARVQRTASQTGVLPVCIGQVLTSLNSTRFQGQTVEFAAHILAGATFSAANSLVTMTIATGTGSDESAANFSTGAWTGYAIAVAQATTVSTSWDIYSAVATIPLTATQIGVKICYTPVGTAGATDFWEMTGARLQVNPAAVAKANSLGTAAYNIGSFERRPAGIEGMLQYGYFFKILEGAPVTIRAPCTMSTTSIANCLIQFPVTMRAAPVFTGDGGFVTGFAASATTASSSVTACTSLAASTTLASTVASPNNFLLNCASSAGFGAAGTGGFLWDNNTGTPGQIKASAEL